MLQTSIHGHFTSKLKPNETILWCGMPKSGFLLKDSDMILIPVSIIFVGFALIFDYILFHYQASFTYISFGFFVTSAAIYLAFFRLMLDARRRKNILYCLTNKRVLMLHGKKRDKFVTLQLRDIGTVDKTIEKDGSGFIIFGSTNPLFPWLFGGFIGPKNIIEGFEYVQDVEAVHEKIAAAISSVVDPLVVEKVKLTEDDLN